MAIKLICLILLISITEASFSQKSKKSLRVPPGTVQINDTLFIDKTEVVNVGWREYLYYLKKYDQVSIDIALLDTLVWMDTLISSASPMSQFYHNHPGFNEYPVVGISYEQAIAFCKWRTYAANQGDYLRENEFNDIQSHLKDTFPIKYYYRLPTKKEWEFIAQGDFSIDNYPYGYDSTYKKWKKRYVHAFNCIYPLEKKDSTSSDGFYTVPVQSFFKNSFGTYCMIGNIAEMVAEKGIAKGGSFYHTLEESKIKNDLYYSKPECWLGFRCVAILIK